MSSSRYEGSSEAAEAEISVGDVQASLSEAVKALSKLNGDLVDTSAVESVQLVDISDDYPDMSAYRDEVSSVVDKAKLEL